MYTICIIKPDVVKEGRSIAVMEDITKNGFNIVQIKEMTFTKEQAESFYEEHRGTDRFFSLINFTIGGPCIAMIVSRASSCITEFRKLVGNTFPDKAEEGTLRCKYGTGVPNNGIHSSDSIGSYFRERKILFGGKE